VPDQLSLFAIWISPMAAEISLPDVTSRTLRQQERLTVLVKRFPVQPRSSFLRSRCFRRFPPRISFPLRLRALHEPSSGPLTRPFSALCFVWKRQDSPPTLFLLRRPGHLGLCTSARLDPQRFCEISPFERSPRSEAKCRVRIPTTPNS